MLQQDYLMRMFTALAIAMRESMLRAQGDEDPEGAAELLEAALDKTTEIDGARALADGTRILCCHGAALSNRSCAHRLYLTHPHARVALPF